MTGPTPVILLDDVLSELDEERKGRVLEAAGRSSQADTRRASDKTFVVEKGMASIG